jgi:hypothetical protein
MMANTQINVGILTNQPKNINFLSPAGYRFTLRRSPTTNFFITDINLPSFSLGFASVPSPFKRIELPGDQPEFGTLQITFKVDEDLANYLEIWNWLVKLGFPESFEQYAQLGNLNTGVGNGPVSDATLSILNSSMSTNLQVDFINLFPTSISELNFSSASTDINYVAATVDFKYNYYSIRKL